VAIAAAALALLLAVVVITLAAGTPNQAGWQLLGWIGGCWLAFTVAVAALHQLPARAAVPVLIIGAVLLQGAAVAYPPRSTDDYHRYAWDGRVQAAGIDPYRYAPVAPELAGLRDDWLFPPSCRSSSPPCSRLNHPTDPTIYPPVAQAEFLAVHLITGPLGADGGRDRTWQVLGALLALATTLALLRVLRTRGDPRHAALWAWCPTAVLECGNNGHVDALAALLVVLALGSAAAGRPARAGLTLGAAIATKILPVLILPALLAGRGKGGIARAGQLLAATAAVIVTAYLPHLIAVGGRVAGFLPGYLSEEGYDGHSRFALLRPLLPDAAAAVAGVLVIALAAVAAVRRNDPRRPWRGALVVVGVAFAVSGISYPWYALLLVALVALDGRWEWLAVAAAAYPPYFSGAVHVPWSTTVRITYGLALTVVVIVWLARRQGAPAV
jgi:hypothetical protein